jgi:hypothetical protein
MALVLQEKHRRSQAKAHGEFGVRLEPDADHSHALLGYTYLRTGHPFRAREHLREALRIDPSDADVEEAYLAADRATRWTYLPMYYWSLVIDRLPGKQFAVWIAVLILAQLLPRMGVPKVAVAVFLLAYFLFCVYTWIATPLTNAWIKMRPPR